MYLCVIDGAFFIKTEIVDQITFIIQLLTDVIMKTKKPTIFVLEQFIFCVNKWNLW